MLLWMPAPHSFTSEDVAELHLPGSPHLLAAALQRLLELGCEAARPGEFTRRAFENGRIDLTRAEGVLAVVDATQRSELRAATALLLGGLERRTRALREALDELRALCEASLDFDESDTGHVPEEELLERAGRCREALEEAGHWEHRRQQGQGRPSVVLRGAPNAGKSSLFNRLVREGRALVSPQAGTTRDVIQGIWKLAGVELRLVDAAGDDPRARAVDARAQERAHAERDAAELVLWVVDSTSAEGVAAGLPVGDLGAERVLGVWSKIDLPESSPEPPPTLPPPTRADRIEWVAVSARTGKGLEDLGRAVQRRLASLPASAPWNEAGGPARELSARHRQALVDSQSALGRAEQGMRSAAPLDWIAQDLRAASDALDSISGRTTPEDLLDRIFSRFCLGK